MNVPITILYIDDDESNRSLLRLIIERRPAWTMIEAARAESGLQQAVALQPTLILLDLSLPDLSGFDVVEHLKRDSRTAAIPVIVLSGDTAEDTIDHALQKGACAFLEKPVSIDRLYQTVETVLADAAGGRVSGKETGPEHDA